MPLAQVILDASLKEIPSSYETLLEIRRHTRESNIRTFFCQSHGIALTIGNE